MKWTINFHRSFDQEFDSMESDLQDALLSHLIPLQLCGPELGRPAVDTLKGSQYGNMKELRFNHDSGVWRVAFAFDPERKGILLVARDKRGADQKKFYKTLIKIADERYADHLSTLK